MGASLDVPRVDLSGKVAVVTGGNTGIGYELVKGLAEMGAHTIMASRSEERATAAIARMKESVGPEKELKVEFLHLDLASLQSTKDFVKAFKEKNLPLHILINNAAVAWLPFSKTDDGYEMHYQVNHLSPFLLTLELLPIMLETASSSGDGRILYVSSAAHTRKYGATFDPENLNSEVQYDRLKTYSKTKLYNVMTAYALQKRLQNVSITVSAQEPGYVKTELSRGLSDKSVLSFFNNIGYNTIARTPKEGAATTLNCAVNPALNSQQALYYASCKESPCNPDGRNEQYQEELWRRSVDALRDHLSPEIMEKYGPTLTPPTAGGDEGGQKDSTPEAPPKDKDGEEGSTPEAPPTTGGDEGGQKDSTPEAPTEDKDGEEGSTPEAPPTTGGDEGGQKDSTPEAPPEDKDGEEGSTLEAPPTTGGDEGGQEEEATEVTETAATAVAVTTEDGVTEVEVQVERDTGGGEGVTSNDGNNAGDGGEVDKEDGD